MSNKLVLLLLLLLPALASTSCKRPCEKAENCVRTCSCLNAETDNRLDCSVAFRCEGATQTCEDAVESSCDDICADYAASGRCGVKRCASDEDCVKTISCPVLDGSGQPTGSFQDCTLGFLCELEEQESCEPRSIVDDATLCQNDCVTGVIQR